MGFLERAARRLSVGHRSAQITERHTKRRKHSSGCQLFLQGRIGPCRQFQKESNVMRLGKGI